MTRKLQFNSKDVQAGDIFIALSGGAGDGHDYVADAIERGAHHAIVSRSIPGVDNSKLVLVSDTTEALHELASKSREEAKAKFIAVTGSVGKTSTKEALYKVLNDFAPSFASRGNFNNHIGVPLNLASMPNDIKYAIFEMGMNHAGELRNLSKAVKPGIALITNIMPVHLEFFASLEAIADAKCEIFEGLSKEGLAVISRDSHYNYCFSKIEHKSYSFGVHEEADSRLTHYEFDTDRAHLEFDICGKIIKVSTKLAGKHIATNLAGVLMVAWLLGIPLEQAAESLSDLSAPLGRGKRLQLKLAGKNCTIIHDCYNASPASMQASLTHLRDIKHQHKIAILADMRELGPNEAKYHRELASFVLGAGITKLYTVGQLMQNLHDSLKHDIESIHFRASEDLQKDILQLIDRDSLILMKGSKSMKLLDLAEYLMSIGESD